MTDILVTTRSGRFVAFRQPDGIHVVDTRGPVPARRIALDPCALECVGDELWLSADSQLWAVPLAREGEPESLVVSVVTQIVPIAGATGALVETADGVKLAERAADGTVSLRGCGLDDVRILAASRKRVVVANGSVVEMRTLGKRDVVVLPIAGGVAMTAAWVMSERAICVWMHGNDGDALIVCTCDGKLVHRIALPRLAACDFADEPALAIGSTGDQLVAIDLRYGRHRGTAEIAEVLALRIDAPRRQMVLARRAERDDRIEVSTVSIDTAFDGPRSQVVEQIAADDSDVGQPDRDPMLDVPTPVVTTVEHAAPDPRADDALPDGLPLALIAPEPPRLNLGVSDAEPYASSAQHLAALLDVVAARTALAIAEAWHSGRTSHDVDGGLPCEREVLGLLGEDVGLAADALDRARLRLADLAARLADRTRATLVHMTLPFVELAREFGLSPIATQIMICATAPRLRGRIARLYGVLAGLAGRSACTDHLLETLVEPEPGRELDNSLARELAPDAPLIRCGLVAIEPHADRLALVVDDVLVDRLRDVHRAVEISAVTTRRAADRSLDEIVCPIEVKRTLLLGLADHDPARPARLVVRGRRGSGRHTLVATLAAQVGRTIACVDVARLPRQHLARALAVELVRAHLAMAIPVISGLDGLDRSDAELRRHLEDVLRRHPGPLAVRTAPECEVPLPPERVDVTLPSLTATQRMSTWRAAMAARGLAELDDTSLESLAARFRFGAGTIHLVVDEVHRRARRDPAPLATIVDDLARRHIAGKLENVATRITRLADWDQVTLVDDMRDSVRELIARMNCQRTVFDDWGYDRRIATARGLTALFYGPPGTGKTLVAGLIGRELGLEVWRIDLARIMSKWIGETEKSLAEVFDAAEEGRVLLLFDEADSLFGKRSEVKSSNDRYANLEVNYLLQRLDSFEGVAILTTNLEGSIDPAFKRRLSMRLNFPFPDEEQRSELWAAHVPPHVPRAGSLDFSELARRYPLSGGYIRNSALRAAFLAAQERRPLSQDHFIRAVQLEYRELGKLSSSGRME